MIISNTTTTTNNHNNNNNDNWLLHLASGGPYCTAPAGHVGLYA